MKKVFVFYIFRVIFATISTIVTISDSSAQSNDGKFVLKNATQNSERDIIQEDKTGDGINNSRYTRELQEKYNFRTKKALNSNEIDKSASENTRQENIKIYKNDQNTKPQSQYQPFQPTKDNLEKFEIGPDKDGTIINVKKFTDMTDVKRNVKYICFECRTPKNETVNLKEAFSGTYISASFSATKFGIDDVNITRITYISDPLPNNSNNQKAVSSQFKSTTTSKTANVIGFSLGGGKIFDYNIYLGQELFLEYVNANITKEQPDNTRISVSMRDIIGYTTKFGMVFWNRALLYGSVGTSMFANTDIKIYDNAQKNIWHYKMTEVGILVLV